METEKTCPAAAGSARRSKPAPKTNAGWWPNQLNLRVLHAGADQASPLDPSFNYARAFETLDLNEVKADLFALMTTSQDWWPADYGHYGPLFIRMAWHSAGTYRIGDGRGGAASGAQRFAPLNSWPDNVNLDKARLLLWPIKQKYGRKLSWADLMILAGTCALESMGLKTLGFAGGRVDAWAPEEDVNWGPEDAWLGDMRYAGDHELESPLAAVQMGLIYVNPEGPSGVPDPLAAARDIRETFARMAMDDEETVALIAGGHTFGKAHGAADPATYVGPEPEAAPLEAQGLGWRNTYGPGHGDATITSGLEGAWTKNPVRWDNDYFDHLFGYEWAQVKSPAGAVQWAPSDRSADSAVPDAHDPSKRHPPMMFTTDLALKADPTYAEISKRFQKHPDAFAQAFARAWYKLTHRDMGPPSRCLGALAPPPQPWQDPLPKPTGEPVTVDDVARLKTAILASGLSTAQLTAAAWASASTFRGSDKRGGADGARLRLAPQKDWAVNEPDQLAVTLSALEAVQRAFNADPTHNRKASLADLIVLGGCVAVEAAAALAGVAVTAPFTPGRVDASQDDTDVASFAALEPKADGFRNYLRTGEQRPAVEHLVDRAQLLTLTAPEMSVLVAGLRVLNINVGGTRHGVFTNRPGVLTNDFFVNLLDMSTTWRESETNPGVYEGRDRRTGTLKWTGSAVDLVFGSNAQLRAIAEHYASQDAEREFVDAFVAAWSKVMNLDRFDLA